MIITTRDFGKMEVSEEDIITFVGPIYGFESFRRFVFLYQEEVSRHFVWLQSVDDAEVCFILISPHEVVESYNCRPTDEAQKLLGDGDYMCWLMTVIKQPFEDSTVNLKSPIVVNPASRKAAQIILEDSYPIRHPLLQNKEEC